MPLTGSASIQLHIAASSVPVVFQQLSNLTEELVSQLCNSKIISKQNLGVEAKMLSKKFSSTLLMKMSLDPEALREMKSNIKSTGDRLIAERGSKVVP